MRNFVEISESRLAANFRAVREAAGRQVEVLAVVKADAYGHGAVGTARILESAGARWFAVTCVEEGVALRGGGIRGRILVLAGFTRAELEAAGEHDLTLMVHTLEDLRELARWAKLRGRQPRFHLKFDTGMGRLGLAEAQAAGVAELLAGCPDLRLEGLATHLASAEDLASGQTRDQLARFRRLVDGLARHGIRPAYVHMANSAALAYVPDSRGSMVRPGLALYGYVMPPRGAAAAPAYQVEPVLAWKARVLSVRNVPAGVPLGYNAAFRTSRPMRVGAIGAGYADGLDRRMSNGGVILAAGRRVAVIGLVSMDVCLADLSEVPSLQPGDYVTLLGREGPEKLDAFDLAARCQTIPYEILCRIGKRAPRLYR